MVTSQSAYILSRLSLSHSCALIAGSLAGQTLATPTGGGESGQIPIMISFLVSNTPRISWRVNWVSDEWGARLPFLACCFGRRRPAFAERVPIYVHTYFIRRLAAECAIQKPDGNLTRLSPSRESLACETNSRWFSYRLFFGLSNLKLDSGYRLRCNHVQSESMFWVWLPVSGRFAVSFRFVSFLVLPTPLPVSISGAIT